MIGTLTINPSIDQHISIDKLVKDDVIRAREVWRDPGGKGINVSRALKELGGKTVAFAFVGGCAGYMLRSLLEDAKIPFESTEILQETRINVILTDKSDKTQTRISAPGPNIQPSQMDHLIEKILRYRPFPSLWVLGGNMPPGVAEDLYARIIPLFRENGAECFLDADGLPLRLSLKERPHLIKPNEFEFSRLVGANLQNEEEMVDAAQKIIENGPKIVAITLGSRGSLVVTEDKVFRATCPRVEVKSKVGAGDSFLAGFVLAFSEGKNIEEAIRLGMAAGTAAVMSEGTHLCRKQDVEQLKPQIQITPVVPSGSKQKNAKISVFDPVCGMQLNSTQTAHRFDLNGEEYFFCSMLCQRHFAKEPKRYIRKL